MHFYHGPTLAAILLAVRSHAAVLWDAYCPHDGPMQATCPNISMYEIGSCECLHTIAFRLLRANSGLPARADIYIMGQCKPTVWILITGKVDAFPSWANLGSHSASCAGPGGSLMHSLSYAWWSIQASCLHSRMYEMDPCNSLHKTAFRLLWAN